jgi:hypothetical protein
VSGFGLSASHSGHTVSRLMTTSTKPLIALIGILCLVACAHAAENKAPLSYDYMELADGRRLTNVTLKTYDVAADKFMLLADGKIMMIPAALVPQPFRDKLKKEVPKSGATTAVTPSQPMPAGDGTGRRPSDPNRQPTPAQPAADNAGPSPAVQLDQHRQAALARAKNYYRYEFRAGSDSISVTAINFEAEQPEAVAGWTDRYRTEGKVYLEFYDSRGGSFNRTTDRFEVLTEQKGGGPIKVVDFTRK